VQSPFGLVDADEQRWLCSFREKPVQTFFIGHMLIERAVLDGVTPESIAAPDGAGLVRVIQSLAASRRARVHTYAGPQITFNTPGDVDRAQRDVIEFFTQPEGTTK